MMPPPRTLRSFPSLASPPLPHTPHRSPSLCLAISCLLLLGCLTIYTLIANQGKLFQWKSRRLILLTRLDDEHMELKGSVAKWNASDLSQDSRGWLLDPAAASARAGVSGATICKAVHVGQIKPGTLRGNHRHLSCNETFVVWGAKTKFRLEGNQSEEQHMQMVNDSQINYLPYHHGDDLLREARAIAARHPSIMMVQSWRSEVMGYTSEVVVVTVEPGVKSLTSDKKIRVLLSFGQHGRELITSEVALRLLSILAGEKDPLIFKVDAVKEVLRKMIIKVVPMENANGRTKVEAGNYCERKNGRGVDINRNWSIDWGKIEKDFDPTEEFPGSEPFSEPETRIMKELARSFKPHLWINVHSGMEAMFMPYDYKSAMPDATFAEPMKQLLQKLNFLHCNNNCVVGPGGGSVGYLAHGTATDYMYEALKVPLAFTFEIYGDPKASNDDCFRMFNPTSERLFENTVTNWGAAFVTIFMELENALKSLPIKSFTWADDDFTFVSVIHKDEVMVSAYPTQERKVFYKNKMLWALEVADMAISTRKSWFSEEWRILHEYVFISCVSLLAFISYIKFRRCPQLLLTRHWTIASPNGCRLVQSQRELRSL